MACRVRDCRAAPSRRNRADSGASAAAPAVHSVAADGRLRRRSAPPPLHSQSLSLVGTLSDSSSPSLEGDRVSLQLWGDIILEHLQILPALLTYSPLRAHNNVCFREVLMLPYLFVL